MEHAAISPSAANRWIHCPGSVALTKDLPDTKSEYAAEGTLAHSICELKLRKYFGITNPGEKKPMGPRKYKAELDKLKEDALYQTEMDGYTDVYVDCIKDAANGFSAAPAVFIEQRVNLSEYIPGGFGSADCILIQGDTLYVYDFKYGKGVPVAAKNNPQMRLYALGAYLMYREFWNIRQVHMTIVQPRRQNICEDVLPIEELLDWAENVVKPAAKKAADGAAEYACGDWCVFCKVKATCRTHADTAVNGVSDFDLMAPPLLSLAELGLLLTKCQTLLDYAKAAEEYALSTALSGEKIEGWKLVEGRSKRIWDDQEKAFDTLKKAGIPEELLWHREPYTLAQIEKQMGKKEFEKTAGKHVQKQPGKPALVPESDDRPEYVVKNAEEDFKAMPVEGDAK